MRADQTRWYPPYSITGPIGANFTSLASFIRAAPNLTTAERDRIVNPRTGTIIYNTTTNKLNVRTASAWEQITSA